MHRALVALLVVGLAVPAVAVPAGGAVDTATCVGPVDRPADAETVVTTRGFRPVGDGFEKRPAFLAAYGPRGQPIRARNLAARGRFAGRAVSVTPNGTLLVSREGDHTVVELLDDDYRPVRTLRFGVGDGPRGDVDARDALLEPEGLLVADDDRLVRYDVDDGRALREWPLPADALGGARSRVTGVAPSGDGYLVTVAGNGTGSLLAVDDGGVAWRVDGLAEPRDPQPLDGTVLVVEAAADRVVELDRSGGTVWALTGLHRPQAARRLPDGRTLVADGGSHRVMTVTPRGRVEWTAYVPWEPADAARAVPGTPPTAESLGAGGSHAVEGQNATYAELGACEAALAALGRNRTERARTVADDGAPVGTVAALVVAAVGLGLVARRAAGRRK